MVNSLIFTNFMLFFSQKWQIQVKNKNKLKFLGMHLINSQGWREIEPFLYLVLCPMRILLN